jgi:hypothetical protein
MPRAFVGAGVATLVATVALLPGRPPDAGWLTTMPGVFLAAMCGSLLALAGVRWLHRIALLAWIAATLVSGAATAWLLSYYGDVWSARVGVYQRRPTVTGDEYTASGAAWVKAHPGDVNRLLFDAAGQADVIWTRDGIQRVRRTLAACYVAAHPLLAVSVLLAWYTARGAGARRRGKHEPCALRVFLSSPGDVAEERRLAREVMSELERSHLLRGRIRFDVVAWDDAYAATPMDAGQSPQESVNRFAGRPADCDLTILIIWSRLGTPLPASLRHELEGTETGSTWEFHDAVRHGRPVFVYRRTETPEAGADDPDREQRRRQLLDVDRFFASLKNADGSIRSGTNEYREPLAFRQMLRQHLEAFISERLSRDDADTTGDAAGSGLAKPTDAATSMARVSDPARRGRRPNPSARSARG